MALVPPPATAIIKEYMDILRKEYCTRRGRALEAFRTRAKSRGHGKQEMPEARSRVSRTGKRSDFTNRNSRALGAVQRTLGVGGCGNICFGHVLVALRQGQRRDTVATGEERFGRCTAGKIKYV